MDEMKKNAYGKACLPLVRKVAYYYYIALYEATLNIERYIHKERDSFLKTALKMLINADKPKAIIKKLNGLIKETKPTGAALLRKRIVVEFTLNNLNHESYPNPLLDLIGKIAAIIGEEFIPDIEKIFITEDERNKNKNREKILVKKNAQPPAFTAEERKACLPLAEKIMLLYYTPQAEGVLSMEQLLDNEEDEFLKKAVMMIVDANECEANVKALNKIIKKDKPVGVELLKRLMVVNAMPCLQDIGHEDMLDDVLIERLGEEYAQEFINAADAIYKKVFGKKKVKYRYKDKMALYEAASQITERGGGCYATALRLMFYFLHSREGGILKLEGFIQDEKDALLKKAMTMVLHGEDPYNVRDAIVVEILNEKPAGTQLLVRLLMLHGVLGIQRGVSGRDMYNLFEMFLDEEHNEKFIEETNAMYDEIFPEEE
jgi:flagellar motor component MotA